MSKTTKEKIKEIVLSKAPPEASITQVEFEGPRLALYTKNPRFLFEGQDFTSELARTVRKRVVIRTSPIARADKKIAENCIKKILPKEVGLSSISFDPSLGEVSLEVNVPTILEANEGALLKKIVEETGWRPSILRTPPMESKILVHISQLMEMRSEERSKILRDVGERIFRNPVVGTDAVFLTSLGGACQVGRSCFLVVTNESKIMIDCGINPGMLDPKFSFPRLDLDVFDLETLDAVIISHAHLDHCGFVPFLFKHGYRGPVYCSEPTLPLMTLLLMDIFEVSSRSGTTMPFDQKDVREMILHTIPLRYGAVTDISPDVKLTLHNAGHILGSSIIHLHIGEGLHNLVYTGDYKYSRTALLEPSVNIFPRVETLVTESTYSGVEDVMPTRTEVEARLAEICNRTLKRGGKVLIPSLAIGRAQEIMLVLDSCMRKGEIVEAPIFVDGMILDVTAIHSAYPEYLSKELRNLILVEGVNPFKSEYITPIKSSSARYETIRGGPSIIIATSGMLEGGPVLGYFKSIAPDEKSTTVFVNYQIEGTLGRRILNGLKEVSMFTDNGKVEIVKVAGEIEKVEGFSGHSDRNQLIGYVRRVFTRKGKVIIVHGEKSKSSSFTSYLGGIYPGKAVMPQLGETIRLI
ncbi:MAG: beta-CASP ribonuclease aCPSF1 [Thermoproteota archaeon]